MEITSEQFAQLASVIGSIGVNIVLMIAFAGMIEAITEFIVAPFFDIVDFLKEHKFLLPMVPIPLGIAGALIYQFDLMYEFSQAAGGAINLTVFGMVLTGILAARGSNFLHQYTEKFFPAKRG